MTLSGSPRPAGAAGREGRARRLLLRAIQSGPAVFLVTTVVCVALLEFVGQRFLFKDRLMKVIVDIDHRPTPNGKDINQDGIRCPTGAEPFRKEDFNLVILGDSFTFSPWVPDTLTFPHQLQTLARARHPELRINVANFGWFSASPLLSYRQLRDIGSKYHPDVVVLCFDMTDFSDDLRYTNLLARSHIYRGLGLCPLTIIGFRKALTLVPRFNWLHEALYGFPSSRFFATKAPLARTAHYLACATRNLAAINQYSGEVLGARFSLMVLPRSFQYSDREVPRNWEKREYEVLGPYCHEPFKYFEGIRDKVGYPIHSLLPDFRDSGVFPTCYERDPHWNAAGCGVAAKAVMKYLEADGMFDAAGHSRR